MNKRRAFSLVEVALSLGIISFSLLGILALLPVGIGTHNTSVRQTAAANLLTSIIADLRAAPASGVSPRYSLNVREEQLTPLYLDENGAPVEPGDASARFRLELRLSQPSAGSRNATLGALSIHWPAVGGKPLGTVSAFIALNQN